jgi:CheY-like chemotaxis protein
METLSPHLPPLILIVDDDKEDQILIREGFEAGEAPKRFHTISDGAEAMEYLFHTGRYARPVEAPRPDLILLDLHMPRVTGRELLAHVKQDEELKNIPVVIFTSSRQEEDVQFCYAAGANAYVGKPADFDQLRAILSSIELCWLEIASPVP